MGSLIKPDFGKKTRERRTEPGVNNGHRSRVKLISFLHRDRLLFIDKLYPDKPKLSLCPACFEEFVCKGSSLLCESCSPIHGDDYDELLRTALDERLKIIGTKISLCVYSMLESGVPVSTSIRRFIEILGKQIEGFDQLDNILVEEFIGRGVEDYLERAAFEIVTSKIPWHIFNYDRRKKAGALHKKHPHIPLDFFANALELYDQARLKEIIDELEKKDECCPECGAPFYED